VSALPVDELDGLPLSEEEWKRHRLDAIASLPAELAGAALPDILLPFQKELLQSTAQHSLTVAEKSRRTGATWGVAADAVLTSGASRAAGGMDTLYLGYNLDMAREFIDTCAMWARAFAPAASAVSEFLFSDGEEQGKERYIQAFRIRFASGFEIVALSSRPRSLRGRQGYVILDEFAFHDDADELLKAAFALLIWGGKLLVISTHNGEANRFNRLIKDIREGKQPGNIVRCTFDDAIRQGLFQRICLVSGKTWSVEAEAAWRAYIRKTYSAHAGEELDCVPSLGSGVYIPRVLIEACTNPELPPVLRLQPPEGFALKPQDYRERFVADWLKANVDPILEKLDKSCVHAFGQDFGMEGDLSVFAPVAKRHNLSRYVPFVIEMRHVPHEQQKQVVFHVCDRLPRRGAGKFDAGGNGSYLAQVTMQRYGATAIECVKLSQPWYLEHVPPFKAAVEDRSFEFTADDFLVEDIAQLKLVNGIPMVPKGAHTDDRDGGKRHGDFAVAAVLGYAASLADVIPIEFQSTGIKRGAPEGEAAEPEIDTSVGFGAVRGDLDLGGWA
jgi:phage FluMu gp28-like protein